MEAQFDAPRSSYEGSLFGASLTKGEITIWKADSLEKVTSVRPGFSGGQQRYVLDPINRLLFSGTWNQGLTCYDFEGNRVIWHRADIIGIQRVDISSAFPTSLFVAVEAEDFRTNEPGIFSGVIELNIETGETRWTTLDWDEMYVHPTEPLIVVVERANRRIGILDGRKRLIGSSPMANFAILDVAFSSDKIVLAEGKTGLRVVGFDGRLLTEYVPSQREPNIVGTAFFSGNICAIDCWEHGYITIVDPVQGKLIHEYQFSPPYDIHFIDNGARLIDRDGQIRSTWDGQIQATLKIPTAG